MIFFIHSFDSWLLVRMCSRWRTVPAPAARQERPRSSRSRGHFNWRILAVIAPSSSRQLRTAGLGTTHSDYAPPHRPTWSVCFSLLNERMPKWGTGSQQILKTGAICAGGATGGTWPAACAVGQKYGYRLRCSCGRSGLSRSNRCGRNQIEQRRVDDRARAIRGASEILPLTAE